MRPLLLAAILAATALAGCADGGEEEPAGDLGLTEEERAMPALHGWVLDEAQRPLQGVNIEIVETGDSVQTDADGFYGVDGLTPGEPVILIATLAAFDPNSKQVTLQPDVPVRLNFTMIRTPVAVPYSEVLEFNGFIACQASLVIQEQEQRTDCGGGQPGDVWEFTAGPDLAGAVIEIAWEPGTPTAASLHARLETLGFGDQNTLLSESIGTSVLRLQVPELQAQKFYPAGGKMRLSVAASPNTDETEAGVGAALAVNQQFEAFASLFYIAPPPASYTLAG